MYKWSMFLTVASLLACSDMPVEKPAPQKTAPDAGRDEEYVGQDYVHVTNRTGPRLSGRVIRVGGGGLYAGLEQAIPHLQAGDLVRLATGIHVLKLDENKGKTLPSDLAIVGAGPESTTLRLSLKHAERLRIEALQIDCADDPFLALHWGGSAQLRGCRVFNYNSGAGGSNAIFGGDTALLIEGCTFEGMSGRNKGRSGGTAFDLRGRNVLYVRDSRFVDNQEIVRAGFPCTFDRCVSEGSSRQFPEISGRALTRKSELRFVSLELATEFSHATDDLDVVRFLLGEQANIDEATRALASRLGLHRKLPYWIGLLRHGDARIRNQAAQRIKALTDQRSALIEAPDPEISARIEEAIRNLDSDDVSSRERATRDLEAAGEVALARLRAVLERGTAEQRIRARAILHYMNTVPVPLHELEYSRMMRWYEECRSHLRWDKEKGRYSVDRYLAATHSQHCGNPSASPSACRVAGIGPCGDQAASEPSERRIPHQDRQPGPGGPGHLLPGTCGVGSCSMILLSECNCRTLKPESLRQ